MVIKAETTVSYESDVAYNRPDLFEQVPEDNLRYILDSAKTIFSENDEIDAANFGKINLIFLVKKSENPIPQKVLIVSRPDNPEAFEITCNDYETLNLIYTEFDKRQQSGDIPLQATSPIARPLELVKLSGIACMINEFVGAEELGSEETLPVFLMGRNLKATYRWAVNPCLTNSSQKFSNQGLTKELMSRLIHEAWQKEKGENYSEISDQLAIAHVAALTKVWLLTGRMPKNYWPIAGDGVLVNKEFDGSIPEELHIRLITVRDGLTTNLSLEQLHDNLLSLKVEPPIYQDFHGGDSYVKPSEHPAYAYLGGHEINIFTNEQINKGIEQAFREFGRDMDS